MAPWIADWQRCQLVARYGMSTGRRERRACPDHLEPLADDTLADQKPGKDNATALLVWRLPPEYVNPRKVLCDYRYTEKPDAPLAPDVSQLTSPDLP